MFEDLCMWRPGRSSSAIPPYLSTLFYEAGLMGEARLAGYGGLSVFPALSMHCTHPFTWALGTRTQVLMLAEQVLYQLSFLPRSMKCNSHDLTES